MDSSTKESSDYFSVSFRIMGDDLDPTIITTLLGIEPDHKHKKGDSNTGKAKSGKIIYYSPYSSGMWAIKSKLDKHSRIQEHIESILEQLVPKKEMLEKLHNDGFEMDFYCGYFFEKTPQPGLWITSDTLKKMGDLGIDLGIDLYG